MSQLQKGGPVKGVHEIDTGFTQDQALGEELISVWTKRAKWAGEIEQEM